MYTLLSAVLIAAAVYLFWQSARLKRKTGLPSGKVIYTDTHLWRELDRTLYDGTIGLAGRPDYIIQRPGEIIPVEIKSKNIKSYPYNSHVLQLAAYCRLVDTNFEIRPEIGILQYSNRTFEIEYSERLESDLLEIIESIQEKSPPAEVHRSHQSAAKCSGCGYASICDEALI